MKNRTQTSIAVTAILFSLCGIQAGDSRAVSQSAVTSNTETAWGLHTSNFRLPGAAVKLNLPDDMAAADQISGTVITEGANQDELNGIVVQISQAGPKSSEKILTTTPVFGKVFKMVVPAAAGGGSGYLIAKLMKNGKELARTTVPMQSQAAATVPDFHLPEVGQAGKPIVITGPCDGDFTNTAIQMGGQELPVLAESPRKIVTESPTNIQGQTTIAVHEGNVSRQGEFRNVKVRLTAPTTQLASGEQTIVAARVSGLDGLRSDLPLRIENRTPSVVQMGGGQIQNVTIHPQDVRAGGFYLWSQPITAIRGGEFNVLATVPQFYGNRPMSPLDGAEPKPEQPVFTAGQSQKEPCSGECEPPVPSQDGDHNIFLTCKACATCTGEGCGCELWRLKRTKPGEPKGEFEKAGGQGEKKPKESGYDYVCWCK
jgi:hypothetical protein